jgi:hypothetical protein
MMKRPRTLSAAFVRTVNRPGVYGDGRGGRGLSLRVHRTLDGADPDMVTAVADSLDFD